MAGWSCFACWVAGWGEGVRGGGAQAALSHGQQLIPAAISAIARVSSQTKEVRDVTDPLTAAAV